MVESQAMLTMWRRHTAKCPHRNKGREYLKCNCPIWADGYIDGKRTLRQSLNTRDIARARKRAVQLESPDATVYKPIDEAASAFLLNCQHLNENTQRKYRNRLQKQLLPFCQRSGIDAVGDLTIERLDEFRSYRNSLAVTTSARELETLRQFLGFCVDRRWITDNPAKRIKPPRNAKPEPVVPYTQEESARIIEATGKIGTADYERKRALAMVLLLRYAGLRISDVALLERSRIQDGVILLHTHKTGATVRLPIPLELESALDDLPVPRGATADSRFFFINGSGSARTAISVVERCLRAVFKLSGVADAHAHRFRHTLATDLLGRGATFEDIADILGNSPEVVRKHYAKWSVQRQDRISDLMRTFHAGTKRARGLKLVVNK